ncbi:TIGR01777 family oxidoreductase [Rhodopirellula sp. MGV]|uniref:TIGR01777 family oxidoreductase n=1 Tax=Rhodopirellula sp. MGV TaxID=2023130 RepID=UPI001E498664|nr:TIGR01777 family oxidoreductase [Rhodopirellula sp. MGV]
MQQFVASTTLPVSAETAFAYHERQGALERLIPPWQSVEVVSSDKSLKPGSVVVLKVSIGPASKTWVAEHVDYQRPDFFADTQRSGPFAAWNHRHEFLSSSDQRCVLRDRVEYELPMGTIGRLFGSDLARRQLESMFAYRHRVTLDDLRLASKYNRDPMTIAVSGATGLVGSRLVSLLRLLGHRVLRLERTAEKADGEDSLAPWSREEDAQRLNGIDAVIHLAGKSIASARWTEKIKQEIRDSRVDLTTELANKLATLETPPKVFVCASATGLYGDRGNEELTEASKPGNDFLASVAQQWEAACQPAASSGIRVCNARFGIVLDPRGGALQKMLLPAKLCGGHLGDGHQWWSWIALDDVVGAIYHLICDERVTGPVNFVAPEPMTNRDFAKTLGHVISRPALVPAPAFGLKLAMGEMADALLLASTKAVPKKLQATGYHFRFERAEEALRYCLGIDRLESND